MDKSRFEKFLLAGELALERQNADGSMPTGKNGPHNHNMTPARNTGHFAIFFLYLYTITSDEKWKLAGRKSLNYLLTLRPLGGSFWHRKEKFKTSYNGLIGQAWSIEALIYGYSVLSEKIYLESCKNLINIHEFDSKECLWHEADLDGATRSLGATLNQQIWFTAMVSKILHNEPGKQLLCEQFLSNIEKHMRIYRGGLLFLSTYKTRIPCTHKIIKFFLDSLKERREIEVGYHVFTITGLTILYEQFPNHEFFKSHKFKKILNYCYSRTFFNELLNYPRYGFEYNVVGFELAYVYSVFHDQLNDDAKLIAKKCFDKQLEFYSCISEGLLACNSFDIETLAARIYEIYRIKESFFEMQL